MSGTDGGVEGQMIGWWTDEWMEGQMVGRKEERHEGWKGVGKMKEERTDGWKSGRMHGRNAGRKDVKDEWMVER